MKWKQIAGDVNYWEHGGVFWEPKKNIMVALMGTEETHKGALQLMFEFQVEEIGLDEWYDTYAVKRFIGGNETYLNQPDHLIWIDIAHYYGWYNLDQAPLYVNRSHFNKLIGAYLKEI